MKIKNDNNCGDVMIINSPVSCQLNGAITLEKSLFRGFAILFGCRYSRLAGLYSVLGLISWV